MSGQPFPLGEDRSFLVTSPKKERGDMAWRRSNLMEIYVNIIGHSFKYFNKELLTSTTSSHSVSVVRLRAHGQN